MSDKKPIDINSEAEFEAAVANAPGEVLVDFVSNDCGVCAEDKPKIEALAQGCDVTVVRVDADRFSKLADKFNVEQVPTLLYAKTAAGMTPKKATDVEPEDVIKKLKCARPKSEP